MDGESDAVSLCDASDSEWDGESDGCVDDGCGFDASDSRLDDESDVCGGDAG